MNQSTARALCSVLIVVFFYQGHAFAQTARGDILRGQGAFAAGVGWYNLRTAKANAINVQAMRNYNQEVRLNYANRVRFWAEKDAARKLSKEEAAKRAEERLRQLRENPTTEDIRSGDALNMLAVMLTDPDASRRDWYIDSLALPEKATVKDIVFQYYPNKMTEQDLKIDVALSRLGQNVDWPLVFTADTFNEERRAYEAAVARVRANVIIGKVEVEALQALQNSLDRLQEEVTTTYGGDRRGYSLKAKDFHGRLKSATKLFDGDVVDYAQELLRETEEYDARTVGELVAFMLKYRLFFSAAETPRSIELYNQLFQVMDRQARELGVSTPTLGDDVSGQDADQFPVGTVLTGKASFLGKDNKPLPREIEVKIEIKRRDGDRFGGELKLGEQAFGIIGSLPTSGTGDVTMRAGPKEEGELNMRGVVQANRTLALGFSGKGKAGREFKGRTRLSP